MSGNHHDDHTKLNAAAHSPEDAFDETVLGEPDPWEPWETKLVLWSLAIGITGLVVLGVLVNILLL